MSDMAENNNDETRDNAANPAPEASAAPDATPEPAATPNASPDHASVPDAPAESAAAVVADSAPANMDPATQLAFNLLVRSDGKFALLVRIYGWFLSVIGWTTAIGSVVIAALLALSFSVVGGELAAKLEDAHLSSLTIALSVVGLLVGLVGCVVMIKLGKSLRKNIHRGAAVWSRRLVWIELIDLALKYMTSGPSADTVLSLLEVLMLVVFSVALDPTLAAERRGKRAADLAADMDAAEQGMLGRDQTGKGYLRLDFFNLFWMFFICCILGLLLEIAWHMTVVDFGHYEDRAGLLFGPFSPIYGFGAVLVTLALNRLYNKNPVITFVVAGIVGGAFEWAVSFFMQMSFGITAWDYSDYTYFGLMPDPVAVACGGRTSTQFLIMWGILGLVWVKFFLPLMLKGINVIPWKLRYGLTVAVAALMLVDGLMTLGTLDRWFERTSGVEPQTSVEQFFDDNFPDSWMRARFQSMEMHTDDSSRVDTARKAGSQSNDAQVEHAEEGESANPTLITGRTV